MRSMSADSEVRLPSRTIAQRRALVSMTVAARRDSRRRREWVSAAAWAKPMSMWMLSGSALTLMSTRWVTFAVRSTSRTCSMTMRERTAVSPPTPHRRIVCRTARSVSPDLSCSTYVCVADVTVMTVGDRAMVRTSAAPGSLGTVTSSAWLVTADTSG
jgi:hypothetical protein